MRRSWERSWLTDTVAAVAEVSERQQRHTAPRRTRAEKLADKLAQRIKKKTGHDLPRALAIAKKAETDLVADLLRFYGTDRLDSRHRKALSKVLIYLSHLAEHVPVPSEPGTKPNSVQRWAFPLDCGLGKTRSIISWLWAMHTSGAPYTVTVLAERVEELCDLWRALVEEKGIRESAIGLYHSKSYREDKAEAARHGRLEDREARLYASLPSTKDWQSRQILLTTHTRLKLDGGELAGPCFHLQSDTGELVKRDVLVWDESLLVAKARTLRLLSLKQARGWIEPAGETLSDDRLRHDFDGAMRWLDSTIRRLELAAQKRERPEIRLAAPANIADTLQAIRVALRNAGARNAKNKAQNHAALTTIEHLVEYASEPATIYTKDDGAEDTLIRFAVEVPESLKRVVVLDASFRLRELTRLPASKVMEAWPRDHYGKLKRYDAVTLHVANRSASYERVERDKKLMAAVADVVEHEIPADDAVILWTHRNDTSDVQKNLREALLERGVDLDATVDVSVRGLDGSTEVEQRPRIVFRTWGRHTADSTLAYCSHAIFATLLFKPAYEIAGQAVGQGGSLSYRPDDLREVLIREVLHDFYQAANRGSMRRVGADMRAAPMHLWLTIPQPQLARLLELLHTEALPGSRLVEWEIDGDRRHHGPSRVELAAAAATLYLRELAQRGATEVLKDQLVRDVEAVGALPLRTRNRLWGRLKGDGVITAAGHRRLLL